MDNQTQRKKEFNDSKNPIYYLLHSMFYSRVLMSVCKGLYHAFLFVS
jgi:hypothetical protein